MVNLTSVPFYRASSAPLSANAATHRAAGYPTVTEESRPPLLRDADFKAAASQSSSNGLEGPVKPPRLPEVGRRRRLQEQQQQQQPGATAVDDATQKSTICSNGAACFAPSTGFAAMDVPPAGTMGLAVGRRHVVQVAGGVMTVYSLGVTGTKSTTVRTVSLKSFFAGAAPSCTGVYDGAAIYDKHADRFVVAATCGGFGRLLVAASATPSAAGSWFMFGLIADAVGTALECKAPKEQALVDYLQLGYNTDGLFVSYYAYCPSKPGVSGASVVALPKWKAYQGAPSMFYPVYTSAEVAAAADLPRGARSVRQLQPVLPQSAQDVQEGVVYFVADHLPAPGDDRSNFTLVALTNTGSLWGYVAGVNGVPAPTLVATQVPWGRDTLINAEAVLKQPNGGADLSPGGAPAGFWSGGVSAVCRRLFGRRARMSK